MLTQPRDEFLAINIRQGKSLLPMQNQHSFQRGFLVRRKRSGGGAFHKRPESLGETRFARPFRFRRHGPGFAADAKNHEEQ